MTERLFSPAERDRLEERLWNWARWSLQDHGRRFGACQSAEHMYRAPREDEEAFVRSAQEPVDVRDACKVEDAVVRLSTGRRAFLRMYYVYRTHPVKLARECNIRGWQVIPVLWATLGALQFHIDNPNVRKVVQVSRTALAPNLSLAHTPCTI